MAYQDIEYELKDGIVTVTMNRPDVMNALSENLEGEIHGAPVLEGSRHVGAARLGRRL